MFTKADKVRLRNEFKADTFKKSPPAVKVSVDPDKGDYFLLVTVKSARARASVKKFVTALELESDVVYKVLGK